MYNKHKEVKSMKKRIGDLRKDLLKLGFDVSEERIRYYEQLGVYRSRRNPDNEYREYHQDDIESIIRSILLIELGVPVKTILVNDKSLINLRIESIKRAINIISTSDK